MDSSIIDVILIAPLATIIGVCLLWFIQLLLIQGQKYLLEKIRKKHEPFCKFTNYLGILFQTICHAFGYTVTKSGISEIYLSVNYGKVTPKKQKKGILEWISNAFLFVGPFFIPAFLLLICLYFILNNFDTTIPSHILESKYTFSGQLTILGFNLYNFIDRFFNFLINIDLFHPIYLGFLFLLIFLGLGIRPSYLGEKKIDKIDISYELKNIWQLINYKPLYIFSLFLLIYSIYYLLFFLNQAIYATFFSIFGWLSIISIVGLFISYLIIIFIFSVDKIKGRKKILPYITIPISYILARVLFIYLSTDMDKSISLIIMILTTIVVIYLLINRKGDKFKTKRKIKRIKNDRKGAEQDE
jgi:hypothetical protein